MLLAYPCPGSKPPIAITTVARHNSRIQLLRWMTDVAATHAAAIMAIVRAGEERERGYRELASRMAHVVSSSVCVAELRLRLVLEGGVTDAKIKQAVSRAIETLGEAQRGLTRARLLDLPWDRYGEDIPLVEFLQDVSSELNKAVAPRVAVEPGDSSSIQPCVHAARERLRYAFRDLLLGVWLLGGKHQPVKWTVRDGQERVQVDIEGDVTDRVGGIPATLILDHFFDPATFLSSDREPSEYGVSFHLARQLIREIRGSDINVANDGEIPLRRLQLVVTLTRSADAQGEPRSSTAKDGAESP